MVTRGGMVLSVLLLAGCSTEPPPLPPLPPIPSAPTTTTTTTTSTTPTVPYKTVEPNARFDLKKAACEQGGVYNNTSLPYAGPGPHYADAYELPMTSRRMQHAPVTSVGADVITPNNINRVVLLACVKPVLGKRAGTVTCEFEEGVAESRTWPFYEATYEVTIREALTGRQITVLTVAGNETPDESCPGFATDDRGTVVARSLTEDGLGEALRPIVMGPA